VQVVGTSKKFRFINTHMEVFSDSVNEDQAMEIIDGPADISKPVIIVGDLNSAPNDDAYERFIDAGFVDAWEQEHPSSNGFTCCQRPRLNNDESELSRRIDYVLVRGAIDIRSVKLVGEDEGDKTSSNLWPSDHAGVVAKLTFQ
jgi:endonuclease/exonuclease/phosphatase family metal-dependent hydrolase